MNKLTGFIASAMLTAGISAAHAGEAPEILGAADYQAMSQSEMASITGERRRNKIVNRNDNINVNQQQQAQCFLLCAGGDVNIGDPDI